MELDRTNLRSLATHAEEAARVAGKFLRSFKAEIVKSEGKDIKIDADKKAHQIVIDELSKTGIPVLSEEDAEHNFDTSTKWVVDPLDGSFNFLRGIPSCAVSIALVEKGEPLLGVIYDFQKDELFSGIAGEGAILNGENISVSQTKEKTEAVVMTGFPSYMDFSKEALEKYISMVQNFKKTRMIGSAALSLAYVACGRADVYYEKDIKIWDVAAGLALVKAAGGNYKKEERGEGKCTIFASNSYIHE